MIHVSTYLPPNPKEVRFIIGCIDKEKSIVIYFQLI